MLLCICWCKLYICIYVCFCVYAGVGCQSVYGSDQLRELGKSADVRQVLTRTGCFKEVDLAQLSEDEKVCFLANLVNLSYIHALIWYECAEAECGQDLGISKDFTKFYGNFRSSRFSKTTHCSLMSGCGYLVGQLGPIRSVIV